MFVPSKFVSDSINSTAYDQRVLILRTRFVIQIGITFLEALAYTGGGVT